MSVETERHRPMAKKPKKKAVKDDDEEEEEEPEEEEEEEEETPPPRAKKKKRRAGLKIDRAAQVSRVELDDLDNRIGALEGFSDLIEGLVENLTGGPLKKTKKNGRKKGDPPPEPKRLMGRKFGGIGTILDSFLDDAEKVLNDDQK